MRAQGKGAIVNISSIHAVAGFQEHSVYAGTRGAIVAFTRTLAVELAHEGIRVVGLAPGSVYVENYDKLYTNYDVQAHGRHHPCRLRRQPGRHRLRRDVPRIGRSPLCGGARPSSSTAAPRRGWPSAKAIAIACPKSATPDTCRKDNAMQTEQERDLWSDVLVVEGDEPVVSYRTGMVVYEESLTHGQFVGRRLERLGLRQLL